MSDQFQEHHKKFCQLMLLCIEGTVKTKWFYISVGLCSNFSTYTYRVASEEMNDTPLLSKGAFVNTMTREFHELLDIEYEGHLYPFNNHNEDNFHQEIYRYDNPQRLAHLRKYAE